jgi:condensation domain-containing protein
MTDLMDRVAALSETKKRLLELKLGGITPRGSSQNESEAELALSPLQEIMWMEQSKQPGSSILNVPLAFHLRGHLNRQALQRAVDEVVRRHEVLRARYAVRQGKPVMIITQESVTVEFREAGLSSESRTRQDLNLEGTRPFNLEGDLPFRAVVFETGHQEHILLLVLHHIACDEWSLSILVNEIRHAYAAACLDQPSRLPELPVQHSDYVRAQLLWVQGLEMNEEVQFWKQELEGAPPVLKLGRTGPQKSGVHSSVGKHGFSVMPAIVEKLRAVSTGKSVTLFTMILAAFGTVLQHGSGAKDILVGTPVSTRSNAAVERLVGLFVNPVALRLRFGSVNSFHDLLGRLGSAIARALSHRNLPFQKVVQETGFERIRGFHPVYQVMFSFHNREEVPGQLGSLAMEQIEMNLASLKCDLMLSASDAGTHLTLEFEYNADKLSSKDMQLLEAKFSLVLEQVAGNPAVSLESVVAGMDELDNRNAMQEKTALQMERAQFSSRARRRPVSTH